MKIFKKLAVTAVLVLGFAIFFGGTSAHAAQKGDVVTYYGREIGVYTDSKTIKYEPTDQVMPYHALNYLLGIKGKLTIVIPKGSDLYVNGKLTPTSNKTIIATGAKITMKPNTYVMMTDPTKKIHDLKIVGGTWRSSDVGGRNGSMFQLAFAKNITLDGVDVNANFNGHAVEIIACSNVTVKNCKIRAIGKNPKDCKEEQIQIDLASKETAPKVAEYGAKYVKGQTCSNIKILNNTVYGARAVGVNYCKEFPAKYHKKITIKGNKLHSTTSEGIQFFNVIGGTISNNVIRTDATRSDANGSYTIGVHIENHGKTPDAMKKSTILVKNNTIYGNRNGVYVKAYFTDNETKCPGKFGTVKITGNKVYCKKGKDNAIGQTKSSCNKWIVEKNKVYQWTKKTKLAVNLKK